MTNEFRRLMKRAFQTGVFTRSLAASVLMILSFTAVGFFSNSAIAQSAKQKKADEENIREQMVVISRQLGVTCTACHDTANFNASDKANYKISKDHMKLTQLLIDGGMDGSKGRQKADCYMCHRGQLKPDSVEKLHPMAK